MDDHASRAMAPLYLGVLLAISMVGPALGYILGSFTTRLYVDFDVVVNPASTSAASASRMTPRDAGWVGAWWLGFLLAAGTMFLLHIPLWFFPQTMEKEREPESSMASTTPVEEEEEGVANAAAGEVELERQSEVRGREDRTLEESEKMDTLLTTTTNNNKKETNNTKKFHTQE